MNPKQIDVLRQLLFARRDVLDRGFELGVAATRRIEFEIMMTLIASALERIDDGSFGECEDCGEAMSFAQLHDSPTDTRCLSCQHCCDGPKHRYLH